MMTFDDLFSGFRHEAFRLERLPQYLVDFERVEFEEFKTTGEIPENFNDDWHRLIRACRSAGKSMKRLRLLSENHSDYERFELSAYPSSVAAGEDIRFALRKDYRESPDFWIFDEEWIALMDYGPYGEYLGQEIRKATTSEMEEVAYWMSVFESADPV